VLDSCHQQRAHGAAVGADRQRIGWHPCETALGVNDVQLGRDYGPLGLDRCEVNGAGPGGGQWICAVHRFLRIPSGGQLRAI
jgi:hypothetical protein